MQAIDFGIEASYTITKNYRAVSQNSRKRNTFHDQYLEIFEKIFVAYREFYDETQQLFKLKLHQKSIYVEEFRNFIRKFAQIIKDTSTYHIDCITQSKLNRDDIITKPTLQIISRVQNCSKSQIKYKSRQEQLITTKQEVNKFYYSLKNEANQPSVFYNTRHMKNKAKLITQKLNQIKNLQNQLKKTKQQVIQNAQQFQGFLINFRKKLLQNKYNMLNRMAEQSKNFRNYLTQILLLLIECVNSKIEIFVGLVKNPKEDTITISQNKGRKKADDLDILVTNLTNSIQQYNHLIDQIVFLLKNLDKALKNLNAKIQQIIQNNKKYLLDNLNNIYTIDETPSRQVNDTLDLYQYFTSKMAGISDKIYIASNKLMVIKQNVKKYADVTLSLIKSNPKPKEQNKQLQFQQVYNQISYDFITEILMEVYKSFKEDLGAVKNYFNIKYYKKKKNKIEDSMQISHIDETVVQTKKRPCKKQLWLWRDWRDKNCFAVIASQVNIKQIEQYISSIKFQEESKQLKNFECTFWNKNLKGILKICQKAIQFISFIGTSNVHLSVSYCQISSLETRVKGSQKQIKIQTQKGQIIFSKFFDIQQTENVIKQAMERANKDRGKMITKRAIVQLTPQQIEYLQKNRAKINEQRRSNQGMQKINTIFVDNIGIDQVYEYIYSDKPFTIRGKPQDNFFAYTQKKLKNFNYVDTPYDKPGPQFYSGNPESKFTNCPLYSTRVCDFDHPMPYIPFMPSACHCQWTCNLYWLSNQSLDYFIQSRTTKAPYADSFVVKILHRVYKQGSGVKFQVSGGMFFIKDTSMKGMLKSKGEAEMIQFAMATIKEIQISLNIVAGNSNENQVQPVQQKTKQNEQKTNQGDKINSQVSKLQNQKKLLIAALVAVFLINIILRFFAS